MHEMKIFGNIFQFRAMTKVRQKSYFINIDGHFSPNHLKNFKKKTISHESLKVNSKFSLFQNFPPETYIYMLYLPNHSPNFTAVR